MTDMDDADFWDSIETSLSGEELQQAIDEASDDEVVCRVCAVGFGQVTAQHLQTHGLTLKEYRNDHPDAPIHPEAAGRQPGRESGFEHSEETKRRISEGVKNSRSGDDV